MVIGQQEWTQLEGKYWKCEPIGQHEIIITDWSIKPVAFKDQPSKPHLCARIIKLDQVPVDKELQTRNQSLTSALKLAIEKAQLAGKSQLQLWISRGMANDYKISVVGAL